MKNLKVSMKKRGQDIRISSCYFCKSKNIKEIKELITSKKGISAETNAFECQSCGKTFHTLGETERVRKILHPTFMQRIKNHFNKPIPQMDIFKGRVL